MSKKKSPSSKASQPVSHEPAPAPSTEQSEKEEAKSEESTDEVDGFLDAPKPKHHKKK